MTRRLHRMGRLALLAIGVVFATCYARPAPAEEIDLEGSDYTVTEVSGRYIVPPAAVTQLAVTRNGSENVSLPFVFLHWGNAWDNIWISANGLATLDNSFASSTRDNKVFPQDSRYGWLCPLWDYLNPVAQGRVVHWIDGDAPNRRFIACWDGVAVGDGVYVGDVSFQIQLYEGTNRIVFAYAPDSVPSTWVGLSATIGLCPNHDGFQPATWDERFVAPLGNSLDLSGHPGTDLQFDPIPIAMTGRIVYDRLVADGDGVGNATSADEPLEGVRVVARQSDGLEVGSAISDANGDWEISLPARLGKDPYVFVQSANDACLVEGDIGDGVYEVYEHHVGTPLDVWEPVDIGTTHLDDTIPTHMLVRGAMHVASTLRAARETVAPHVAATLPALRTRFDAGSSSATSLVQGGGGASTYLRVAGAGASNPDQWDPGPPILAYGRFVLEALGALPGGSRDRDFDAVTSDANAFAEAFGYYLFAAVTGESTFTDTVDADTATSIDLEDPDPATAAGPDVTAWVAAALHDLVDGDNEAPDRVDGTGGAFGALLEVVEGLGAPTDAGGVHEAWGSARANAFELTRLFGAHGLIADDDSEMNDDGNEAAPIGVAPVLVTDRILQLYAEDWFEVELASGVPQLNAQVDFNRVLLDTTVVFELRSAGGVLLATGSSPDASVPPTIQSGPLTAGTYRLRVAWQDGMVVPDYSLQAYEPLEMFELAALEWTVNRPYEATVGSRGGVPPLSLDADPFGSEPPGLRFVDAEFLSGTPTSAGAFTFRQLLSDSGSPQHVRSRGQTLTINPALRVELGEFVGVPLARAFEIIRPDPGGTAPRVFTVIDAAPPAGTALDATTLRLHGTATTLGATTFSVHGGDVAGSTDEVTTTAVVCVAAEAKRTALPLDEDEAATGMYVDAISGATLTFAAKTAKRAAKRVLAPILLGPDARPVALSGSKGKSGKASAKSEPLPVSGRYYCLFAADGGPASELSASVKTKLGKKDSGGFIGGASGALETIELGGLEGTRLTLTVKPAKRSDAEAAIASVMRPDGSSVAFADLVTRKGAKAILRITFDAGGTWKIIMRANSSTDGGVTWKAKLKHPKGGSFSAD